jgi:DNA modification methylase
LTVTIRTGDCREVLTTMAPEAVHMCVTSPPYFGLRDYGVEGQMGLEESPDAYVAGMVEVFREVRRVLRADGTLWLNIGDSYANDGKWGGSTGGKAAKALHGATGIGRRKVVTGLKPKDLIGIPWMLAFALRADGWYLRQEIIWHKKNPMPESVSDRCTKAHESLFLLSKSPRYYFDADAIKERAVSDHLAGNQSHKAATAYEQGDEKHRTKAGLVAYCERQRRKRDSFKRDDSKRASVIPGQAVGTHRPDRAESEYDLDTRNKRSVWTIATRPFREAHFATFPPALVEPCILAGSQPGGTVLDPFGGAGTTGLVAEALGRDSILIELNPKYVDIAERRTKQGGMTLEAVA